MGQIITIALFNVFHNGAIFNNTILMGKGRNHFTSGDKYFCLALSSGLKKRNRLGKNYLVRYIFSCSFHRLGNSLTFLIRCLAYSIFNELPCICTRMNHVHHLLIIYIKNYRKNKVHHLLIFYISNWINKIEKFMSFCLSFRLTYNIILFIIRNH